MPDIAASGIYFGEGPRWHDGRLWFSDFYGHCVHALAPDGSVTVHADVSAFARYRSNDMLVDAAGRAYVGNFGFDNEAPDPDARQPVAASLTCVSPDGEVTEAAAGLMFPNGMVLTPDGATLIVAETYAARLTAFDVSPGGVLSGRRVWADLSAAGIYPDGICLDAEGAVWVANARQPSCLRVQAGGEILQEERFSQRCYACALGGTDRQTLYAMTAPSSAAARAAAAPLALVEQARVPVPGAGLP